MNPKTSRHDDDAALPDDTVFRNLVRYEQQLPVHEVPTTSVAKSTSHSTTPSCSTPCATAPKPT